LVSNLVFVRNLTLVLVLFLIGLHTFLVSLLYLNSICSEGNIVDHISAKHKLAWCCLKCCMIGASNSLVTMQLIEGSNQMDYLLILLDFHDCFPSQMVWECHWQPCVLAQIISFACGMLVVTYSWFGFNAIIVLQTHLFELTFEFPSISIVKVWRFLLYVERTIAIYGYHLF
jgi:hypothetical protein